MLGHRTKSLNYFATDLYFHTGSLAPNQKECHSTARKRHPLNNVNGLLLWSRQVQQQNKNTRGVLEEEYTHTCLVKKLTPGVIRLQGALLIPLKQLKIIRAGGAESHVRQFIVKTVNHSESPKGDSGLCTITAAKIL